MKIIKNDVSGIPSNAELGYQNLSEEEKRIEVIEYYLAFFPDSRISDLDKIITTDSPESCRLRNRFDLIMKNINPLFKTTKNENTK